MRYMITALALTIAAPLGAQETRFTKQMSAGSTLEIENINGNVEVTQGSGRTAEVVVTKTVKRGDGNLVKAIMEERGGVVRVCTIYLNHDPNRTRCDGSNSSDSRRGDRFEVKMDYVVRLPAGVRLNVETVNGNVNVGSIDATANIETVNGNIDVESASASSFETVNGNIRGSFSSASWDGTLQMETVNGNIELSFPSNLAATIRGETVNGSINSDFAVTISGKWGPKSFRGTVGGGGRELDIGTVNGDITLRKR